MKRKLIVALVVLTTAVVAVTGTAFADPPTPSAASTLQVGVPYSGTFTSDKDDGSRGWMRLPVLHRKDMIQFAVSNDARGSFNICLTGPVDDFGADAAYDACNFEHGLSGGRKGRFRSTYTGATGQAYLVICCESQGTYTVALEGVTTWVGVGWAQRRSVTRKLALTAFARYGDNTAVVDGTQIALTWKPAGAPRSAWKKLVTAKTKGGSVVLRGTLPASVRGRNVDLRACASAGTCAQSLRVRVR